MNATLKQIFDASQEQIENEELVQKPFQWNMCGIMKQDPMSPYTPPQSPTNYTSITDILRRKPYKGAFPQSFTRVPNYFGKYGISPYYEPEEFNDYARGAITIENMIELTNSRLPWQLDRDQDVIEIIGITEEYYKQLTNPANINERNAKIVEAYRQKLEVFLQTMYRAKQKVELRNCGRIKPTSLLDIMKKFLGGK